MQSSPSQRRRQRARRAKLSRARRRRRLILPVGIVAAIVAVLLLAGGASRPGSPHTAMESRLVARAAPTPLAAPVSGESVVAMPGGPLILGGLDSSSNSVSGVFQLDRASGRLHDAGALAGPLHDAAAAVLGNRVLVLGGGTSTSTDAVQTLPAPGGRVASDATAETTGTLPTVRSDLSAVSLGGRTYVLGGYDGSEPIDSVLATEDGAAFTEVARLRAPARYMAIARLAGHIYAFGGETGNGGASDAIQEVDPNAGTSEVIGHLPQGVSHASAVSLGGHIYVLGGEADGSATDRIWRFDPANGTVAPAGRLPLPISNGAATTVGSTGYLIGGTGSDMTPLPTIVTLTVRRQARAPKPDVARHHRGYPFAGRLMIADRGNNRLIVVGPRKQVLWQFPSRAHPAPAGGFYFPDDAFFTHHGTGVISNEEQNERIVQISFPSGKLRWSYGHPGVTGSQLGYLHEPDDAYLLKNGTVSVADAQNCRILLISHAKKILKAFGSPTACTHEPPHHLASPNGDTPLRNGNILVSEVNGSYIDEITPEGKLVWSTQLPISYPSDPQQLGPDRYLVANYASPGGIYEFNRAGKILWSYQPSSGSRMLNHPSLAERLPGGLIAVNDDYRDRVVIIDPRTRKVVWQYGHTDEPGTAPGYLHIPDGFDLLAPDRTTPTHPYTG
jgi:outer membrane protein assembly factor BamB